MNREERTKALIETNNYIFSIVLLNENLQKIPDFDLNQNEANELLKRFQTIIMWISSDAAHEYIEGPFGFKIDLAISKLEDYLSGDNKLYNLEALKKFENKMGYDIRTQRIYLFISKNIGGLSEKYVTGLDPTIMYPMISTAWNDFLMSGTQDAHEILQSSIITNSTKLNLFIKIQNMLIMIYSLYEIFWIEGYKYWKEKQLMGIQMLVDDLNPMEYLSIVTVYPEDDKNQTINWFQKNFEGMFCYNKNKPGMLKLINVTQIPQYQSQNDDLRNIRYVTFDVYNGNSDPHNLLKMQELLSDGVVCFQLKEKTMKATKNMQEFIKSKTFLYLNETILLSDVQKIIAMLNDIESFSFTASEFINQFNANENSIKEITNTIGNNILEMINMPVNFIDSEIILNSYNQLILNFKRLTLNTNSNGNLISYLSKYIIKTTEKSTQNLDKPFIKEFLEDMLKMYTSKIKPFQQVEKELLELVIERIRLCLLELSEASNKYLNKPKPDIFLNKMDYGQIIESEEVIPFPKELFETKKGSYMDKEGNIVFNDMEGNSNEPFDEYLDSDESYKTFPLEPMKQAWYHFYYQIVGFSGFSDIRKLYDFDLSFSTLQSLTNISLNTTNSEIDGTFTVIKSFNDLLNKAQDMFYNHKDDIDVLAPYSTAFGGAWIFDDIMMKSLYLVIFGLNSLLSVAKMCVEYTKITLKDSLQRSVFIVDSKTWEWIEQLVNNPEKEFKRIIATIVPGNPSGLWLHLRGKEIAFTYFDTNNDGTLKVIGVTPPIVINGIPLRDTTKVFSNQYKMSSDIFGQVPQFNTENIGKEQSNNDPNSMDWENNNNSGAPPPKSNKQFPTGNIPKPPKFNSGFQNNFNSFPPTPNPRPPNQYKNKSTNIPFIPFSKNNFF